MSSVSLINGHIDDDEVIEMTDNEIVNALKRCINKDLVVFWHIEEFPTVCDDWFVARTPVTIKDIERVLSNQKAEIERQNDLLHRQSDVISEQKEKIDRIYAEAVIECADLSIKRICENVTPIPQQRYLVNMCIQEIENTKKEMVGGNNE